MMGTETPPKKMTGMQLPYCAISEERCDCRACGLECTKRKPANDSLADSFPAEWKSYIDSWMAMYPSMVKPKPIIGPAPKPKAESFAIPFL